MPTVRQDNSPRPGRDPKLEPESTVLEVSLDDWRHKASDIVLVVLAAAFLPVVVMIILGYRPPLARVPEAVFVAVYFLLSAAALLRRVSWRLRVAASISVLYLALSMAMFINPRGPFTMIGLVAFPILGLVLLGFPAARIAIVASTIFILSAPGMREQPGVIHLLGLQGAQEPEPVHLIWFRATVELAFLLTFSVLLTRFHSFLLNALAQRIAAQRKIEDEMNERQRLEREIASISDGERRRLGQELHDGVCQQVTAALLRCQALERRLERGGEVSDKDFAPLSSLLAETIDDAHNVARGLCPLEPDPEALAPAMRALTRRMQEMAAVRCEFRAEGDVRVDDPEAAQHLYRIAQEALSNAVRHAHADRIGVELQRSDGHLTLKIEDNGTGLPVELPAGGMGLRTMAYRAQIMKGDFTVERIRDGGTRVTCRMPLAAEAVPTGQHV